LFYGEGGETEAGEEEEEEAGRKRENGENGFSKGLISFPFILLFTFTK